MSILNIRLGYPEMTPVHESLRALLPDLYKEATSSTNITREADIAILQKFFGLSDRALPYSSAASAMGEALDSVTASGDAVIVFPPYWHEYPNLIRDAGDSNRHVISLQNDHRDTFERAVRESQYPVKAIILNSPRNPDMYVPNEETLQGLIEVADQNGITIIFDEVLAFYCSEAKIHRDADGNRLEWNVPRAQSSLIIRDTAKLFACPPFPKMAMLDMNEGAIKAGADRLKRRHWNRHFADANLDLRVFCGLLNHADFPQFVMDLRALAAKNFELLQSTLKDIEVRHGGGPFAMVRVEGVQDLLSHGVDVVNSVEMGTPEKIDPFIRVPIVKDPQKFADIVSELQRIFLTS